MIEIENMSNPEFYFDFLEMEKDFEASQLLSEINNN